MAESLALWTEKDDAEFNKMREEPQAAPSPPASQQPPEEPSTAPPSPEVPTPEQSKEPDLKNWVPLSAHLEEKKERKRLEQLYQEAAERTARLDERYRIIEERLNPPTPLPDRAADPVGYLEHQARIAQETAGKSQETAQALQQRLDAFEHQQRLAATVSATEQTFAQTTPDYYDAVDHLRQVRMQQYALAGLDEQEQQQALIADTRNWTLALLQKGKNAAEATYELAKTYGYQNVGSKNPVSSLNGSGEQPRNNDGTFAKVEQAKNNLRKVAAGQQAAKSLGDSVGASAPTGLPSPAELEKMSDEDFDKWTNGKQWKKFWQ